MSVYSSVQITLTLDTNIAPSLIDIALTNWSHHGWTNKSKHPGVETVSKVSHSKYLKITAHL